MPTDTPLLWFNPNCSNARGARQLLEERGVEVEILDYRRNPPSRHELEALVRKVGGPPGDLVRRDTRFADLEVDPATLDSVDAVVDLLVEHVELLERPVLESGDRAVIGRPPERVLDLLD